MDKYYGNVCELDIIFNFQKAYFILDELLLAGELQESSKKNVLRCISQEDSLEDMEVRMLSHSFFDSDLEGTSQCLLWILLSSFAPSAQGCHTNCEPLHHQVDEEVTKIM
jgi:Clathrin adaptor complex small chain